MARKTGSFKSIEAKERHNISLTPTAFKGLKIMIKQLDKGDKKVTLSSYLEEVGLNIFNNSQSKPDQFLQTE